MGRLRVLTLAKCRPRPGKLDEQSVCHERLLPRRKRMVAIELATNQEKLAAIMDKLANNRLPTPLRHNNVHRHRAAYTAMYEQFQANLPPDHIDVPG